MDCFTQIENYSICPSMLKKKLSKAQKHSAAVLLLPLSFVYLPRSISFWLYPPEQVGRSKIILSFTLKTVVCAWKTHDPSSGHTCLG